METTSFFAARTLASRPPATGDAATDGAVDGAVDTAVDGAATVGPTDGAVEAPPPDEHAASNMPATTMTIGRRMVELV